MSIRGRLNQLQGRANSLMSKADWTLDDAKEAIRLGMSLVEMIMDGVRVDVVVEDDAISKLSSILFKGQKGNIPLSFDIDIAASNYPPTDKPVYFDGGPFDGKTMQVPLSHAKRKAIVLDAKRAPKPTEESSIYTWDRDHFTYEGASGKF